MEKFFAVISLLLGMIIFINGIIVISTGKVFWDLPFIKQNKDKSSSTIIGAWHLFNGLIWVICGFFFYMELIMMRIR
jgi:hypothetical protein